MVTDGMLCVILYTIKYRYDIIKEAPSLATVAGYKVSGQISSGLRCIEVAQYYRSYEKHAF